jgi:iron complex outermembrane receptor protein
LRRNLGVTGQPARSFARHPDPYEPAANRKHYSAAAPLSPLRRTAVVTGPREPSVRFVVRLAQPSSKIATECAAADANQNPPDRTCTRSVSRWFVVALTAAVFTRIAFADAPIADALAEIMVTAEKQASNLQKTPAAVTAVPSDVLIYGGVTTLIDAERLVPSVRFQTEGNNTEVFIRGVGGDLDFPNVEPNVAFNIAGIYQPREADSAAFFDVRQLEILPGPQGTLYGRSAIGGVINLTPARPGFNDDGETILELGNYSAAHITVTQNYKASESVALRLAVDYNRNSGFQSYGADSKNDTSVRLSTIINPTDRVSAYFFFQGANKHGFFENPVNKGLDPNTGTYCEQCFLNSNPWNYTRTGVYVGTFGTPAPQRNEYKTDLIGGQIDYQLDGMVLSYLPSYLYLDSNPSYWLGVIESSNSAHYNQLTQELRLASNGMGPYNWLAGLAYFDSRNYGTEYLFPNLPIAFYQNQVSFDRLVGESAFGQLTSSVTDSLRLTGGGRLSSTKRDANGLEVQAIGGLPYAFDKTYTHFDWKAGAAYDLSLKIMLYANVQTGYQQGTFNPLRDTPTQSNAVQPEKLIAYTAGVKSRWLDDRVQINNEIYYYEYKDLIIQSYDISAPFNPAFNGNKVGIRGDQLDVLAKLSIQDDVNVNLGYARSRNQDVADPFSGKNYDGLSTPYSPDYTVALGYTRNVPVGAAMVRAHIDWRFEGSWYADYVHNKGTEQVASNKGYATLTYDARRWTAGLWIKNITDRVTIAATAAAGIPGPATGYLADPRTFGARFTVKY